ncbi:hypothetical protein HZC20_01635 [Candidatus Peregrinibacteria bacterium]|nr:hypothetical protein [Candidatus Peregrinibacteria bacterium]
MPINLPSSPASTGVLNIAENYDIRGIISYGLAYAIIIAGFLSVAFIFFGGISFILSGGQEEKIKSAVSTIRYAIIGLIVTILATVIVGTVGKALGLDIIRYINLSDIIHLITSITAQTGSSGPQTLQ